MVSPEAIAAAWATWHSRHGGKLGPGPAFAEAIAAAVAVESAATQCAGLIAGLREAAEKLEKRKEEVLAAMDKNGDSINDRDNARSVALLTLNVAQQDIRARITALEEEGRS